jgi:hypothetical protein
MFLLLSPGSGNSFPICSRKPIRDVNEGWKHVNQKVLSSKEVSQINCFQLKLHNRGALDGREAFPAFSAATLMRTRNGSSED